MYPQKQERFHKLRVLAQNTLRKMSETYGESEVAFLTPDLRTDVVMPGKNHDAHVAMSGIKRLKLALIQSLT
jgi:hypothetical protein